MSHLYENCQQNHVHHQQLRSRYQGSHKCSHSVASANRVKAKQVWIQTSHPQAKKPPTSQAKSLLASLSVCLLYTNPILLQCSAWLHATYQWLNNDRERSSSLLARCIPSLHFYFCPGVHVMHVFTGQKGIKLFFKFFFGNPVIFTALQLFPQINLTQHDYWKKSASPNRE